MTLPEPLPLQPVIGDIVHFVFAQRHWAAIITHVWDESTVNLYVFPDATANYGYTQSVGSIKFNASGKPDRTWHWAEQEPVDDAEPLPIGGAAALAEPTLTGAAALGQTRWFPRTRR